MKKQLKRMLFLTTVATMTMVPMMVANAGEWKQDAGGGEGREPGWFQLDK